MSKFKLNSKINYLNNNEIYKNHAPRHTERRKIFSNLKFTSLSLDKGKKINNVKIEIKDKLNNFTHKNIIRHNYVLLRNHKFHR